MAKIMPATIGNIGALEKLRPRGPKSSADVKDASPPVRLLAPTSKQTHRLVIQRDVTSLTILRRSAFDGQDSAFEVDGFPPQGQQFATPKSRVHGEKHRRREMVAEMRPRRNNSYSRSWRHALLDRRASRISASRVSSAVLSRDSSCRSKNLILGRRSIRGLSTQRTGLSASLPFLTAPFSTLESVKMSRITVVATRPVFTRLIFHDSMRSTVIRSPDGSANRW